MANAGLYVDPDQPHQVKLEGKVVGDIDILAVDPKSDIRIGVTCKNWETNPESKDFNHFVSMLEKIEVSLSYSFKGACLQVLVSLTVSSTLLGILYYGYPLVFAFDFHLGQDS